MSSSLGPCIKGLGLGGGVLGASVVNAVDTEGWRLTWASGTPPTFNPDVSPVTVTLSRQGYAYSAGAVNTSTISEDIVVTQRLRLPYPNQATIDPTLCAASDYIYSTDTAPGVTNNSTEISPPPVCAWGMPARAVVGDTLPLEIIAAHRNGRNGQMVAAVKFIATDGTNTVNQVVSGATAISGRGGDQQPVLSIKCNLDITTLSNNSLITVTAEVYPFIGAVASVATTATVTYGNAVTGTREFSQRYFYKSTALAGAPPLAYVDAAGNDSTGTWSTSAVAASALPFLTVAGAFTAYNNATRGINAATGLGNILDGARIRIKAGTFTLGSVGAGTIPQNIGETVIERDPNVARANAIVIWGAAQFRPRFGSVNASIVLSQIRFSDVTVQRSGGSSTIAGESAGGFLDIVWDDVNIDGGSVTASWLSSSHNWFFGAACTNMGTSNFAAGVGINKMLRGISGTFATTYNFEHWTCLGCNFNGFGTFASGGGRTKAGAMIMFNIIRGPKATGAIIDPTDPQATPGQVVAQNLVEGTIGTTSYTCLIPSADTPQTSPSVHCIIANNTIAGWWSACRTNFFYDDTVGTHRFQRLNLSHGNIVPALSSKNDIDVSDGTYTGNWAYQFGVGCRGTHQMEVDAALSGVFLGSIVTQQFGGLKFTQSLSSTVRNDPLFTNDQSVHWSGVGTGLAATAAAGAGGGTYTVSSSSPCKARLDRSVFSHDLAGTARPITGDTSGAYVAP